MSANDCAASGVAGQGTQFREVFLREDARVAPLPVVRCADDGIRMLAITADQGCNALAFEQWLIGNKVKNRAAGITKSFCAEAHCTA